jgi:hypothetical protein
LSELSLLVFLFLFHVTQCCNVVLTFVAIVVGGGGVDGGVKFIIFERNLVFR